MPELARLAGGINSDGLDLDQRHATVSAKRADRVREAKAAIDYSPDQIARSLRVGRLGVIGMVIPDVINAFR